MSKERSNRQGFGPRGFGAPVEKPKNFKGTLKRLIGYLKPHKIHLAVVLVFAVASTVFAIYAPKVTSKAVNKLQDSYMAQKVLSGIDEAQRSVFDEIYEQMSASQAEAIDGINEKIAEGQMDAVDRITSEIENTQEEVIDSLFKSFGEAQSSATNAMVNGFYSGMVAGQTEGLNQIYKQMGDVQIQLIDQTESLAELGMAEPEKVDMDLVESMMELVDLPLIRDINNKNRKREVTIEFIDLLIDLPEMPGMEKIDKNELKNLKKIILLPLIEDAKPSERAKLIRKFIELTDAPISYDSETMSVLYNRMPNATYIKNNAGGSGSQSMIDAGERLLRLPLLSSVTEANKKKNVLIQLIDIFRIMPSSANNMGGYGTLSTIKELVELPRLSQIKDPKKKLDTTTKLISTLQKLPQMEGSKKVEIKASDLKTVKELLNLPNIQEVRGKQKKADVVSKLIRLLNKLPDMAAGAGEENKTSIDSSELKAIRKFLKMPMLEDVEKEKEKRKALSNLLDTFSEMPEMEKDNEDAFDADTINDIKEFVGFSFINSMENSEEKANATKRFLEIGKTLQEKMPDAPESAEMNINLTDQQLEGVVKAIRETNGEYDFKYVGQIVIILIIMYLISALFSLVMGLVMSGVSQKTVFTLRSEVDKKLSKLPLKYYDDHTHGDLLSRVTNDVDTIANTLQQSLTQVITSIIQIVGFIIMMLSISPTLTLIIFITLPLYVLVTMTIAKKSQKYFAAQQQELGDLSGHVEEMYTGHKIVKAYGLEEKSIDRFEGINLKLYESGWKAQFVSGIMFPLMNFVSNLSYVFISIVGGLWITKNMLKVGDILAFIQYSKQFTHPIVQTSNIANVIQSTIACAERVFEVLDEKEELPDSKNSITLDAPRGEVAFENVSFRYREDVPLINDLNLKVESGHTIAIVGPTGAGKTTLVNLLMRFYEINGGKICIDGIDIRDLKRGALRKMFGMVLQDTWLFNGTIRDNIAYAKPDAPIEEVVAAAKAAHADHFIRTLPEGYDTVLNEDTTNISQGQKQLLTIARAVLAEPKILILDEATSSVDTRTEVLIQKAMLNLMKNRTSFVIAHRLSTIRDAEKILVMNDGSIIEIGRHEELLEKGGFYAELYNSQFAGNTPAV